MKKVFIISGALIIVLIIVAAVFYYFMQQPLYIPGMVRQEENLRAPLKAPVQNDADSNYWNVENDIKLYHTKQGSGDDVLIIHGGPGMPTNQFWQGLDSLKERYSFHYYHQRGSGKSTRPFDAFDSQNYYENMQVLERTLGIGAQIADIERIRKILGKDKLTLIGHSFGAFLASLYAVEFPEHVNAMILIGPADVMVFPSENDFFEQIASMLPEGERGTFGNFLEKYLDFSNIFSKTENDLRNNQIEFGQYYSLAVKSKGIELPNNLFSEEDIAGWGVYALYFSMGQKHDYSDNFKDINIPVLVVHGNKDLQTQESSKKYNAYFAGSEFVEIENAGHFPFNSQPEIFAKVTEEFLTKVSKN